MPLSSPDFAARPSALPPPPPNCAALVHSPPPADAPAAAAQQRAACTRPHAARTRPHAARVRPLAAPALLPARAASARQRLAFALLFPLLLLLGRTDAFSAAPGCSSLNGPACFALNRRAPPSYGRHLSRSLLPASPTWAGVANAAAFAAAAAAAAGVTPELQRTFRFDLGDGVVVDVALEAQSALVERGPLIEGMMDALVRAVSARSGGAPAHGALLEKMRSAVELVVDGAIMPDALAAAEAAAERRREDVGEQQGRAKGRAA
jgi:hypothetical protein